MKLNICLFLLKNDELLEKHSKIWEKVSNSIERGFLSEPKYNEKYLITKVKSFERKNNTNFNGEEIRKEGSQCICSSVILIDSVYRTGKNYYSQVFLEECKYFVKEKKILSMLLTI